MGSSTGIHSTYDSETCIDYSGAAVVSNGNYPLKSKNNPGN